MKQFRISLAAQAAIAAMALGLFGITGCTGGGDSGATGTKTDAKTGEGGKIKRPPTTAPGNSAKGDTIPIGLVTSLSGDNKPWGDDCKKGAEIAVDDFNAAGGVNGKKIDLKVSDSGSKPEVGKSAAEKLISDGVLGLVGEVASGITMQMGQAAFEKGIPVVAVGATRTDLADIGNNMFRVCYTDDFQGPVMANFAYTELGLRNIAIITDKKLPYSTGLSDSFHATFTKLGGKIIDEQFYETGNKDFKGQLTNVKAKNPDGLFMSGYFTEVGPLGKQAREQGINAKLLGGDGWDSQTIITSGKPGIIGGYFCNHYNDTDTRPQVQDFLKKWAKKFGGKPGTTMGALGYDGAMITFDALKRAKSLDSKSLIEALENTEKFPGVSGDITLKGMNGNPEKRALVVEVTEKGFVFRKAYEGNQVKK